MMLNKLHLLSKLPIWAPRYSDAYKATEERVALLACYKVDSGSPVILVEFTKARHLQGLRFCITRQQAQGYPVDSNGKIPCYAVPMSALEHWDTYAEVSEIANMLQFDGTEGVVI